MPRGDGTGPRGQGSKTGGGAGTGRLGRMSGTKAGSGPGGKCLCPSCGATIAQKLGTPCYQSKCPKCGAAMARK